MINFYMTNKQTKPKLNQNQNQGLGILVKQKFLLLQQTTMESKQSEYYIVPNNLFKPRFYKMFSREPQSIIVALAELKYKVKKDSIPEETVNSIIAKSISYGRHGDEYVAHCGLS